MLFKFSRYGGYECSSKGDARFSAFNARLEDGRSIEEHYQCDVKGYQPGGRNWRLGKGKPPVREVNLWEEYLSLWKRWAAMHPELIDELASRAAAYDYVLSDRFASTPVNQARALCEILNSRHKPHIRVYNKAKEVPPKGAVYVGRPSKWGNPFIIGKDGSREEVIEKYKQFLESRPDLVEAARAELRGKNLVCWCAPLACHADVLMDIANN